MNDRTVAIHVPSDRPTWFALDEVASSPMAARTIDSALAWIGRVDLVLHGHDPVPEPPGASPDGHVLAALTIRENRPWMAVEVAGDVGAETADVLAFALGRVLDHRPNGAYLHLGAVTSCDPYGMEPIIHAQRHLDDAEVTLLLVAVPSVVRSTMRASGVGQRLVVQDRIPLGTFDRTTPPVTAGFGSVIRGLA
jgi:anti-anti-sigma regulatory factor